MSYRYLDAISSPRDLAAIPESEMPRVAEEIRAFLIEKVEKTGGHLASNLGVVELTLALHRVFDFEKDHLIFDVGHQSYVHKLLTGRKDAFDTLRTPGGLSGFTSRDESVYDAFGAGHSSTAVSAALGFAEADFLAGRDLYSVAVFGDGAYTGGMVHEALNNIRPARNLILILNENEMSIAKNIGKFASYIAKVRSSRRYVKAKRRTTSLLHKLPLVGRPAYRLIRKIKRKLKNALYNSNYFEEMGLYYIGPVNGNDYAFVKSALCEAKEKGMAVLIHLKTVKGKGYRKAEENPSLYHSIPKSAPPPDSFHKVFGDTLLSLAAADPRICAVTAAMSEGTGLTAFEEQYASRFFDVGIAEPHAVTFAAGLAAEGMRPFFAVYSTFLQRAYDNLLHDVALQRLPVKLAIDRAGLAVADGATHHGIFDVAFLSTIPEMELFAPATYGTMEAILRDMARSPAPQAIRYPNAAEDARVAPLFYPAGDYTAYGVRPSFAEGEALDILLLTYGSAVSTLIDVKEAAAAHGLRVGLLLIEALRPEAAVAARLLPFLKTGTPAVFYEEAAFSGGCAMSLDAALRPHGCAFTEILAIRNSFAKPQSRVESLLSAVGLGKENLLNTVLRLTGKQAP